MHSLGDWLVEHREKSTVPDQYRVLTSSRNGLVLQTDYYADGRIAGRNNVGFHVIPPDFITYRSRSDDGLFFFNLNDTGKTGIVSHFYPVFRFPKGSDLFFLALMNHHRQRFLGHSVGTSQKVLSMNALKKMQFALPPLSEQKKIAEILSTCDAAIETTGKLLANAENQKRALMQQLLTGKRRLKGFETSQWKKGTLGSILEIHYGKSPNGVSVEQGSYPIIGTGGVTGMANDWLVQGPAIVIGRKGTIDRPTLVNGKFWPIDTTFFCRAKADVSIDWAFKLLEGMNLRRYNEASGVPSLSRGTLRAIPIEIPHPAEQGLIGDVLSNEDATMRGLREQLDRLGKERRSLMQQLLTGKQRVTV